MSSELHAGHFLNEKKKVPVVGNLLEVLLPDFMIDEEDPGHNAEHLVQQVHLRDRVLLVP
jgi:hypothetical protein